LLIATPATEPTSSLLFSFPAHTPPQLYPLSLHDALPISSDPPHARNEPNRSGIRRPPGGHCDRGDGQPYHQTGSQDYSRALGRVDQKSTRLNSSHVAISYAVFCVKKNRPRQPCRTSSP